MKTFGAFILIGLTACVSAQDRTVGSAPNCKLDTQIVAEAEAAVAAVEKRLKTGEPAPVRPEDAGKTPAQLAEEAAISSQPCENHPPTNDMQEIPQVDRF
jgi:hypothetical protein